MMMFFLVVTTSQELKRAFFIDYFIAAPFFQNLNYINAYKYTVYKSLILHSYNKKEKKKIITRDE